MLSKFGPESWALLAVVLAFLHTPIIDCCNPQLQMPKRDIPLAFWHKRDRSYCIHNKMLHVKFHETAFRKLLVFTLYVYPYISNGVSHFNLLDELITTFGGRYWCFSFLFKFLANNSGEPDLVPPWLYVVWSGSALFANFPQNGNKA